VIRKELSTYMSASHGDPTDTQAPEDQPDVVAPPRRQDELSSLTTAELRAELDRRHLELDELQPQRHQLMEQLAVLDRKIRAVERPDGGRAERATTDTVSNGDLLPVPHRWEAFDTLPLAEAIARLMAIGDVTSPQEITDALLAKGYGTRTKSLRTRVAQVLASESRFQRVARGRYERRA
jgi:hypothetical protein